MSEVKTQVPSWAQAPQPVYPQYQQSARHYRFDGESGLIFVGTEHVFGDLWVQPIACRWQAGVRWGREYQEWFDLAFVDQEHIVGQISLKKASAINVQDYLMRLEGGKICEAPVLKQAVWLHLVPEEKRTTDDDPYWVMGVEESNFASEQQFRDLQKFVESGVFEWHLPGEVFDRAMVV
ncbi:MAG: hypothetical protein AAFX78_01860 [Cyanobacteria bacterium J06638_20]